MNHWVVQILKDAGLRIRAVEHMSDWPLFWNPENFHFRHWNDNEAVDVEAGMIGFSWQRKNGSLHAARIPAGLHRNEVSEAWVMKRGLELAAS